MLTPEQIEFFLSFKSFIPNQDANSAQEFARLARTRRWKVGGQTFKKNSKVFELLPAPQPADDDNKEGGKEGGVRDLRNKLQALELAQATVPTDSLPGSRLTSVSANFAQLVREKNLKPRSAEFITAAADFFASAAHAAVGGSSLNSDILYELCRDLRIDPIPSSNTQCKKAIDRVHVNILDYLDYRRSAGASPLPVFTSFRQFSEYTVSHGKIFPKIYAKKSPVLKKLLKQIFCIHIVQMAASDANARCLVSFAVGMRARSA